MAVFKYATLYENVNGDVLGFWLRTTSDNIATWKTDGYLDVDGVHVLEGTLAAGAEMQVALLEFAAALTIEQLPGTQRTDSAATPTTFAERTDAARDPLYPYGV